MDSVSVLLHASRLAYSIPRVDGANRYSRVEVGYVSRFESLLGPMQEVWGYIPVDLVVKIVEKHSLMPDWLRAEFDDIFDLERIQDRLEGVRTAF